MVLSSELLHRLDVFLFSALPYVAMTVFFVVTIQRYRQDSFAYSSLSSQFLEDKQHFWSLVPFHYGLLFVLAAATLLIGGIGVLNMMLDAVHERRREIGVRLAVGARRRDVVAQFFLETFTISLVGGLAGAVLGIGACLLLGSFELPELIPRPNLRGDIVAWALGVLILTGVGSGVIPAWRASRTQPVEALRYE